MKHDENYETTDEVLARILDDLKTLTGWAETDVEHSEESDAPEQAELDRWRVSAYKKAYDTLDAAHKDGW